MSRTSNRPLFRILAGILKPLYRAVATVEWHGREHLPATGGFVVAPNHLTELDPITVGYPVYDAGIMPRFLAKESLFRVPLFGAMIRRMGQVPVYRGGPRAKDSLDAAFAELADGGVILVYPEGTVTRDPEMWPMRAHTGAARLALRAGVPVVPVGHWGDQQILYRDPDGHRTWSLFPRKTVRVSFGQPLWPRDLLPPGRDMPEHPTAEQLNHATLVIMDRITQLVAQLRCEQPPTEHFDPRRRGAER